MYRTKLATSLLLLGIGACQRADDLAQSRKPLVDENRRPAVGNIGQTGRPDKPAAAAPLATVDGSPAVGNIGQTGRPVQREAPRRVVTVRERRATRRVQPEIPRQPQIQADVAAGAIEPLVRPDRRPAVGNVPRKRAPSAEELQAIRARQQELAIEPLQRPDGRPAVGNTLRKGGGSEE